jgi:uncharacterized delta-60 repeat protein
VGTRLDGLAVSADGSILFGDSGEGCSGSAHVRRLLPNGAPDPTFGEGGVGEGLPLTIDHLALDATGRIVVAGIHSGPCGKTLPPTELAVARLLPDGRLDQSFGAGGVVLFGGVGLKDSRAQGLAVREGGGILLAGGADLGASGHLIALTGAGALDPGFGGDGLVELPNSPRSMLTLSGGEILVAGSTSQLCCPKAGSFVLSRYLGNGSPDPSFGEGGVAQLAIADVNEAEDLGIAPGGKVLLAGATADADSCNGGCAFAPVLLRIEASGTLDPSFGEGGRVSLEPPRRAPGLAFKPRIADMAVTPDGRALLAGEAGRSSDAFVIARLADGRADTSFGAGGTVDEVRMLPSSSEAAGVAVEPGGGILVSAWSDVGANEARAGMLRFRSNGAVDDDLGSASGFATTSVSGALRIGARGRAYAVSPSFGEKRGYVARFDRLGRQDRGYGTEGAAYLPTGFVAFSFLARADGHVLVIGRVAQRAGMAAFQLTRRGTADRGFGRGGLAFARFGRKVKTLAETAVIDSRDRIVLVGRAGPMAAVARLSPDGSIDRSFARSGRLTIAPNYWVEKTAVALQPSGGILLAIGPEAANRGDVTLRRLGRGGRLDRSFGRRGVLRVRRSGTPLLAIFPGARQIVVTMGHGAWGESGVTLRAYRHSGEIDRHFGRGGIATAATSRRNIFRPVAAARQRDGRIVVAGTTGKIEALGARVGLLRFR